MLVGVLVGGPATGGVPPVLDDVRLGELLTLAVAEATLSLAAGHQMRLVEIDLEPLTDVVLNSRSRTPRSAAFLYSNPAPIKPKIFVK